jgi:glycosyltransferase involved in cell wall biosynthesis
VAKITPAILHVSQPVEGGVSRCVREHVADQLARGWHVSVACPEGELAEGVRERGAGHLAWPAGRNPGLATALETTRLRRLLDDNAFALVHLHSSKAGLAGRLALRGRLPTVFQPHGWSFYPLSGPLRRAAIAWEQASARWAHAVLCVSETERRRGEDAGIRARWEIVPNGIDPHALPAATDEDRADARARLGRDGSPLVVCLGRICRAKGQDVLLEAWPRVLDRVPEARLVFVGGGPDAQALGKRPPERVTFVGERTDAPDWLAAADVVAAPSRWEGMSFAMLETMARARSLVITDVPGARDALGEDAPGIVPLGDLSALAAAITERLLDPALAASEGASARTHVERRYDIRDSTRGVARLYARVLGTPLEGLEDPELAAAG